MKGDTVLDYVELRLTPPLTRCELFVSANDVIEKLASGFLKPFLMHLRALEEQVARGCNSVRLEHPQSLDKCHGRSWFTKGTLERFVRFVSTPEVLERVKSVEDELAQLEQVRSIQASSLRQAEGFSMGADSAAAKADAHIHSGIMGSSKLLRRYQNSAAESGAEASKIELLRAMDLRLLALQQEQSTAFGRAAAAGFSSKNMADLIAFSEYFGAERLCIACLNFLAMLKNRHAFSQSTHLDPEAVSSGSGISSSGLDVGFSQGPRVDVQDGSDHSEDDTHDLVSISSNKETDFNSSSNRGSCGTEVRKRWGPPENIYTNLYEDLNETDSNSSNGASNGVSVNCSPEVQSSMKETTVVNLEQEMGQKDTLFGNSATETGTTLNFAQNKNDAKVVTTGSMNSSLKQSLEAHVDCNGGASQFPSSSERRSSLPLRKGSTESSLQNLNSCSFQEPSDEMKRAVKLSSEASESHKTGEDVVGFETSSTPVVAPTRRLSVQDAISLFENKQRRDSVDSSGKYRPGKQESNRVSSEGAGVCPVGNPILKRRDSAKGLEIGMVLQETPLSSNPEADFCPVLLSTSSLVCPSSLDPTGSSQENPENSSAQPLSGTPIKALSTSQWQPSVPSGFAKVEPATGKALTHHQESIVSECVKQAPEGDWRKQFKLQLEKSLAKESFSRNLPVKDDLQKIEKGLSLPEKTLNDVKFDPMKSNNSGPLVMPKLASRNKEALGKGGISFEWRQPPPIPGASGSKTLPVSYPEVHAGQNDLNKPESCLLSFKKKEAMNVQGGGKDDIAKLLVISDNATDQRSGRESLGSSLVNPLDHDLQALVTMADHQMVEDGKDSGGLKGRFYEQYRKLRDAKLMEDQDSKRAEREAKLRAMEETLTRRKAEMDARAGRLSKNGVNQMRATKVVALKADLHTPKKEQQDGGQEGNKSVWKDQVKPIVSSTSPPLTPYTSKEVTSTSKPQSGKKAGAVVVSQKGATPPRNSGRPIPSVSPKLAPRSTITAAGNLRKSVASSTTDNPLARSVPCFANLRKENTKPALGRPLGSARVHPKNGGLGRMRGVNEAAPLEANANVPARSNFLRKGPTKEDQQQRSALMRKSCATASDFKFQSASSDDGVLAPLKGQREMKTETAVYNKLRQSAVGPLQEAKPFLRKGRGIGPGTGPGLIKQKASPAADVAKSCDDETTSQTAEQINGDGASEVLEGVLNESNSSEVENMDLEDDVPVDFVSIDYMEMQEIDTVNTVHEDSGAATLDLPATVDTFIAEPLPDNLYDMERACHTISLPIDIETHNRYAVEFGAETDSKPLFDPNVLGLKEEEIEALSQQEEHATESFEEQLNDASSSLHTSSLPHEHDMPVFPPVPPSPPSSSVVRYDQSSPFSSVKLESPIGSPASWNSSQLHYGDVAHSNKKWVACQKPVASSQQAPKEPIRGFKRLLKFGRKGRASEVATADCISASTTSEGDDESEDQSRFVDEVSSRGRLQERRFNDVLGDHHKAEEEGSALNVRSSIPTPPANFRLRDDHMSGGTMLKAPRSFFSLSSFRSRGCEWKSR